MEFCLQYLTIKVCDYKPCDITFAVLNFGISDRVQQQTNKQNTNKNKEKDYGK